jgi:hypothetical protein
MVWYTSDGETPCELKPRYIMDERRDASGERVARYALERRAYPWPP